MLCTDDVRLADFCLEVCYLKHFFSLLRQGDITHLRSRHFLVGTLLDFLLELVKVYIEVFKDSCRNALSFLDQAQKQVLRSYIVMTQPESLLTAVTDDILYSVRKVSVHSRALLVNVLVRAFSNA